MIYMEKGIKVGDRVRVSEDAPRVYTDGWRLNWRFDWRNSDSLVGIVEEDDAVISPDDSGGEELAIPCKYLVKVDTEAEEAKFKVGDMVWYRLDGKRYEVMGKTVKYHYALNGYDSDVLESDLEPYTEPNYTEPEINTWDDLVEAGKVETMNADITIWRNPEDEREIDITDNCGSTPAERKALATLKIAQLIDAAYGGIVTAEEHSCRKTHQYDLSEDGEINIVAAYKTYDILAFHTEEQAERFLKHNESLVRAYYCLPDRKEDTPC